MAYPGKYTRQYDYVSYQNTNPARPLPAPKLHADLNLLAQLSDDAVEFLKGFTRSDGRLANESVGLDQLEPAVAAMIGDTEVIDDLIAASGTAVAAASTASAAATSASASASSATASAGAASTSATNAATSASNAATSASNAATTLASAVVGVGSSVDSEIMLFSGTGGKTAKRASVTGLLKAASGVLSAAVNLTDYFLPARGADIASAATLNLGAATGDLVDVTGTTTVTAITLADGAVRTIRAAGIFKLTNGASLVLPGGSDIITAVGDFITFRGYAAGVVRCVNYQIFNLYEEVATLVSAGSPFIVPASGTGGFVWNTVAIPRAGLWEVGGNTGLFVRTGTPVVTHMHADFNAVGQTTILSAPGAGSTTAMHITSNDPNVWVMPHSTVLFRTTGARTMNFVMTCDYSGGTLNAYGRSYARRVAP
jgi:hypothetical protein